MNINKFLLLNVLFLMFFSRFASAEDLKDYYLSVTSKNVMLDVNINDFPAFKDESKVGGGSFPISYNMKNGINKFEVNYVLVGEEDFLIKVDLVFYGRYGEERIVIFDSEGNADDIVPLKKYTDAYEVEGTSKLDGSQYVSENGKVHSSLSNKVFVSLNGSAFDYMPWGKSEEIEINDIDKDELYRAYEKFHGYILNSNFDKVKLEASEVWGRIAKSYDMGGVNDYIKAVNPEKNIKPRVDGEVLQPLMSPDKYTVELVGNKVLRLRPNPIMWKKDGSSSETFISYTFFYDKNGNLKLAGMPPN
jgi:hypothetical protein